MEKIDFKKELKALYKASAKKIELVEIPELNYFVMKGSGAPGEGPLFEEAINVLYSMAYTLKFMMKEEDKQPEGYHDFVIPPLEATWCMGDEKFDNTQPEKWQWELMVMHPQWIDDKVIEMAKKEILANKELPGLERLEVHTVPSYKAAKMLHIGPYNEVGKIYEKLGAHITEKGMTCSNKSREVYLSDPRRTAPEKLKTVVLLPV